MPIQLARRTLLALILVGVAVFHFGYGTGAYADPVASGAVVAVAFAPDGDDATADSDVDSPDASAVVSRTQGSGVARTKKERLRKRDINPIPARVPPLRKYRISAVFRQPGPHSGGIHSGLDFAAPTGREILAVSGGKVIAARAMGGAGNSVIVRMPNGQHVLYGHMSRIGAKPGQRVQPGDAIGRVGSTGNSTGPHLHLQVNQPNGGEAIDPLRMMKMSLNEVKRMGRA
ncbi:MAG: M23 family metallopeptidase [Actinomycetia bacterium]|nr:M23 family metallopeptidase [Actinomycetes bacterium]